MSGKVYFNFITISFFLHLKVSRPLRCEDMLKIVSITQILKSRVLITLGDSRLEFNNTIHARDSTENR